MPSLNTIKPHSKKAQVLARVRPPSSLTQSPCWPCCASRGLLVRAVRCPSDSDQGATVGAPVRRLPVQRLTLPKSFRGCVDPGLVLPRSPPSRCFRRSLVDTKRHPDSPSYRSANFVSAPCKRPSKSSHLPLAEAGAVNFHPRGSKLPRIVDLISSE